MDQLRVWSYQLGVWSWINANGVLYELCGTNELVANEPMNFQYQ